MSTRIADLDDDFNLLDLEDYDRITLPGIRARRIDVGDLRAGESALGLFVQASRQSSRDVTRTPLVGDLPERKSECKRVEHKGERFLPVRMFTTDPNRPNGCDRYCKACRAELAAQRRAARKAARADARATTPAA